MANIDKLKSIIINYASKLAAEGLCQKGKDTISFRIDDTNMLVVKSSKNFATLTAQDIKTTNIDIAHKDREFALHSNVYTTRTETNAILHTHPIYSTAASIAGITIPPVLDDMAQIVGPTIRVSKSNEMKDIWKALKGRDACLIKDDGLFTTGRTMTEVYTSCLVLDKACKCFIAAEVIGGAIALKKYEAVLMHIVYKKKYSKANQTNILAEERE